VPTTSRLDRASLQKIASAGGGQYFELDRDGDRHIANTIIDTAKRMAPSLGASEQPKSSTGGSSLSPRYFPSSE
jgi:hypothetical protein